MIRQGVAKLFGLEERQSQGLTDQVVQTLLAAARSGSVSGDFENLAVVQSIGAAYGMAFAAAKPSHGVEVLTPSILHTMGRQLIFYGESAWLIEVGDGAIELLPVKISSVSGSASPRTWRYQVEQAIPSTEGTSTLNRSITADQLIHLRINSNPPWKGRSPLASSTLTATLASALEAALGDEASTIHGQIVPTPTVGKDPTLDDAKADIAKMRGDLAFVQSMAGGSGLGPASAPRGDWQVVRLGADFPMANVALRSQVQTALISASGIPPDLIEGSSSGATASRESLRRWLRTVLIPLATIVANEISSKLDYPEFTLNMSELKAGDVSSPARAYKALVDSGMDEDKALIASGLELLS